MTEENIAWCSYCGKPIINESVDFELWSDKTGQVFIRHKECK